MTARPSVLSGTFDAIDDERIGWRSRDREFETQLASQGLEKIRSGGCSIIGRRVVYPSGHVEELALRDFECEPEVNDEGLVGGREEVSRSVRVPRA